MSQLRTRGTTGARERRWRGRAYLSPWMQIARSLVMWPRLTAAMHAVSSARLKRASSLLLSSLARCSKPRVHAKIDAMGFVDVSPPCSWKRRRSERRCER